MTGFNTLPQQTITQETYKTKPNPRLDKELLTFAASFMCSPSAPFQLLAVINAIPSLGQPLRYKIATFVQSFNCSQMEKQDPSDHTIESQS
jgi:hypothetical protein